MLNSFLLKRTLLTFENKSYLYDTVEIINPLKTFNVQNLGHER